MRVLDHMPIRTSCRGDETLQPQFSRTCIRKSICPILITDIYFKSAMTLRFDFCRRNNFLIDDLDCYYFYTFLWHIPRSVLSGRHLLLRSNLFPPPPPPPFPSISFPFYTIFFFFIFSFQISFFPLSQITHEVICIGLLIVPRLIYSRNENFINPQKNVL